MLTAVLLTKLPSDFRLIVTRKAKGEELNLETLLELWEEELVAREQSQNLD